MRRPCGNRLGCLGLALLCLPLAIAGAEAPTASSPPSPGAPVGGGTYVVKKGDTLWGIAKNLFNDPFLWPRIWERNPFITDPKRIFPGDTLTLPGGEPAPPPVAEAPKPEPPKEAPKVEEAKAPPPAAPPPPKAEEKLAPPPPVPPASEHAIACSPVLAAEGSRARLGIGSIVKSDDDRLLLSQADQVFVGLDPAQTAKTGDRLAVIRTGSQVLHPRSRRSLGRILYTLGVLEVTAVQDRTIRARVSYGCEAMTKGDRVAPFALAPFPADKVAKPTTQQVEGTILDSPRAVQLLAQQFLVFLDVGLRQGINPGDVFAIFRPSKPELNPVTRQEHPIAPERLGEAVVIRVTEETATAVLTASGKESRPGDRVALSRQVQP